MHYPYSEKNMYYSCEIKLKMCICLCVLVIKTFYIQITIRINEISFVNTYVLKFLLSISLIVTQKKPYP